MYTSNRFDTPAVVASRPLIGTSAYRFVGSGRPNPCTERDGGRRTDGAPLSGRTGGAARTDRGPVLDADERWTRKAAVRHIGEL